MSARGGRVRSDANPLVRESLAEVDRLQTRGVVLIPEDLSYAPWPQLAKQGG